MDAIRQRMTPEAGDHSAYLSRFARSRACQWAKMAFTLGALGMIALAIPWQDQRADPVSLDTETGAIERDRGGTRLAGGTNQTSVNKKVVVEPGVVTLLRSVRLHWLAGFYACTVASALLLVVRWRLLLPADGNSPSTRWCGVIWARSQVINLLPLAQLGGDAYRVERSGRHLGSMSLALGVVALERLIGLLALLTVAMLGLAWFLRNPSVLAIGLGFALLGLALLPRARRFLVRVSWRPRTELGKRVGEVFAESLRPFAGVARCPGRACAVLGLSLGIHLLAPLTFAAIDRSLGLATPVWCYLVAVPAISVASFLPIHIAGIGVLEGGLYLFLHRWSGASAAEVIALSAGSRMLGLAWLALLSGAFLLSPGPASESRALKVTPRVFPEVNRHRRNVALGRPRIEPPEHGRLCGYHERIEA